MRTTRLLAAVLAAGVLAAGCSADDAGFTEASGDMATDDSGSDESMADAPAEDMEEEGEAADGGDAERGTVDDVVTFGGSGSAVTGRQLARTASIILEVQDVEQAATRVAAAAQRAGGFVSDAEVRGGDFGSGYLRLRVPARALDATVEDLAAIGDRVVESSISTEDLTDQLTDLGARIDNLERLEAELQLLLADVRDSDPQASQLLQVFERINQVRGEIERLEAQRAGAQDRVALATINVELLPRSIAPEEMEPEPEGTLAQAWESTKDAFGAIADALIWLVVTILPVALAVLGLPALLLWLAIRWLRTRREQRLAQTPPGPPTPPTSPTGDGNGSDGPAADDSAPSDEDASNPHADTSA